MCGFKVSSFKKNSTRSRKSYQATIESKMKAISLLKKLRQLHDICTLLNTTMYE